MRIGWTSRRIAVALGLTLGALASCAYDWRFTPDGGAGDADLPPPLDAGSDTPAEVGADFDGGRESGVPQRSCGPEPCGPEMYCSYDGGTCGPSGPTLAVGVCRSNTPCDSKSLRCGCDGTVADECSLHARGLDVDTTGTRCKFKCGGTECFGGRQYCAMEGGLGRCVDCGPLACDCAAIAKPPCTCQTPRPWEPTVTCP